MSAARMCQDCDEAPPSSPWAILCRPCVYLRKLARNNARTDALRHPCAKCPTLVHPNSTLCRSCHGIECPPHSHARRPEIGNAPWEQAERELTHVTFGLPYQQQTREQRNAVTARSIEIAVARGVWPTVSDVQRKEAA